MYLTYVIPTANNLFLCELSECGSLSLPIDVCHSAINQFVNLGNSSRPVALTSTFPSACFAFKVVSGLTLVKGSGDGQVLLHGEL
jgi:hypothetical protein